MYRIGEFSKMNRVTIKTLRYYDQIGLLKPDYVDEQNGYRYYTSKQIPILHKIISLKQVGLSNDTIRSIMDNPNNTANMFKCKKDELQQSIQENLQQISRISYYLKRIEEEYVMNYEVVLKELPEVIVYSKEMVVPNYESYFSLIPQIGDEVLKANPNIKCRVPEYCFIQYHDKVYKEENIHVEFCEAVDSFGKDTEDIKFKLMKKVSKAACVYHKGPYSTLGEAYGYLINWIQENGYEMTDSPRESYIDGIWNNSNEDEWLTELQIPIT